MEVPKRVILDSSVIIGLLRNKPEDVTCPYALLAMAVFEKVTGRKVKVADSRYFKEGTETIIQALAPLTFEVYDYDKIREKETNPC